MRTLVVVFLVTMLAACAEPAIDASSRERLDQSLDEVLLSVPEEERPLLAEAMTLVVMEGGREGSPEGAPEREALPAGVPPGLAALDGMTASDFLREAARIREGREVD